MERMKRMSVVPVLAACGVFASAAIADQPRDEVKGNGISAVGTDIHLNAHTGGSDGASGHVNLKNSEDPTRGETKGKVVCVNSVGNVATVVYLVKKAESEVATEGQYRKLRLEDNGTPPKKGPPVDRIQGSPGTDAPQTCDQPLAARGGILRKGDITVVDGG